MSAKENMVKGWTEEAQRITREAISAVNNIVEGVEPQLKQLMAAWKLASDGLSASAFELLAKGGRVTSFKCSSKDSNGRLEFRGCSIELDY